MKYTRLTITLFLLCVFLSACRSTSDTKETTFAETSATTGNQETLYFINEPKADRLVKINSDGTGKQELIFDEELRRVFVHNGWIYYNSWSGPNAYKMQFDSRKKIQLPGEIETHFQVHGDWIYYIAGENQSLYKMKTDGTGNRQLSTQWLGEFIVADNAIFFTVYETDDEPSPLFRMDTDGKNQKTIDIDRPSMLSAGGGHLLVKSLSSEGIWTVNKLHFETMTLTKLKTDYPVYDINDSHIVYVGSNGTDIHIADLDGANDSIIYKESHAVEELKLLNNALYFRIDYQFGRSYTMNLDGTDKVLLSDLISEANQRWYLVDMYDADES